MRVRSCASDVVLVAVLLTPLVGAAASAQTTGVREVSASGQSVIPLQTRIRFTTMIVLPEGEEILDVICGDKDFWVISATHNLAHIKPAKEGAATNLNLVTASGTVYSFLLNEHSGTATPDVKVYVTADPSAPATLCVVDPGASASRNAWQSSRSIPTQPAADATTSGRKSNPPRRRAADRTVAARQGRAALRSGAPDARAGTQRRRPVDGRRDDGRPHNEVTGATVPG